jgi:hypothetical protein
MQEEEEEEERRRRRGEEEEAAHFRILQDQQKEGCLCLKASYTSSVRTHARLVA